MIRLFAITFFLGTQVPINLLWAKNLPNQQCIFGGNSEPKISGPFGAKTGGQFAPKSGGQYGAKSPTDERDKKYWNYIKKVKLEFLE